MHRMWKISVDNGYAQFWLGFATMFTAVYNNSGTVDLKSLKIPYLLRLYKA